MMLARLMSVFSKAVSLPACSTFWWWHQGRELVYDFSSN